MLDQPAAAAGSSLFVRASRAPQSQAGNPNAQSGACSEVVGALTAGCGWRTTMKRAGGSGPVFGDLIATASGGLRYRLMKFS